MCNSEMEESPEIRAESAEEIQPRLHIGCGTELLQGWINIDLKEAPGVEALDVRGGLPYENVEFIFCEHFIEHLTFAEGRFFLQECRRVMNDGGVLRLSTPNLDWVWMTQYHPYEWSSQGEGVRDCFWMNKAFRGWGHQFLYNAQTLTTLLKSVGFEQVKICRYGESNVEQLRSLERHEKYKDSPELPHIIIVEATGRASSVPQHEQMVISVAEYEEAISSL